MSSSDCCFLTCIQISQEAGQVVWCSCLFKNFPQFVLIHKVFGIVNKADVDVFLELFCFFNDLVDVANLISGSSAFSKSGLNVWKFLVHVLLNTGLENFEHYFASVLDECNCAVVLTFFGFAFLLDWNENWPFPVLFQSWTVLNSSRTVPVLQHCWVFQICWHIECSTFIASSFRIWNSSIGILSPPLALFVVMLPKAHLTLHSRMSEEQTSWGRNEEEKLMASRELILISINSLVVTSDIFNYFLLPLIPCSVVT